MRLPPLFLLLCAGFASHPFLPATASAQTLAGQVLDQSNGAPVALVWVTLVDLDSLPVAYAFTDTAGHFLLTAPDGGSYWVDAEYQFFSDYHFGPVSLSPGDTLRVRVTLVPDPVELDELVVEAKRRRRRLTMEGYFGRVRSGTGWHLDRDRIERYAHFRISEALVTVPGLRLVSAGYGDRDPVFGGWRNPTSGGTCYPHVFIDGMLFGQGGSLPTHIDRLIRPEEVEAIEVFRFPTEVPNRFRWIRVQCGVIAIWSR